MDISEMLEIWADYIRGGRVLGAPRHCILAKFAEGSGIRDAVFTSKSLMYRESIAEDIESLVQRLHALKPDQAVVLRTEYGLTRFWDTRSQGYRAAKMNIPLRTYEYRLGRAKKQLETWFDVEK